MSSSTENNNFFNDFLDDYFAECEEHLAVVRRELLALESWVDRPQIDGSILNELFRSFHSIKGLSAMVGVRDAEELAHHMESYLRSLRDRQITLKPEGFDALMVGTQILEQAIESRRDDAAESPDIAPAILRLETLIPSDPAPPTATAVTPCEVKLKPEDVDRLKALAQSRRPIWHFTFSPDTELSKRGVGVNSIRERLTQIGELIHVAPRLKADNKIVFDFILATDEAEGTFAGWEAEGLSWEPFQIAETEAAVEPSAPREESEESEIAEEAPPDGDGDGEPSETAIAPPTAKTAPLMGASNLVRVDLPKLDELMRMVGELVITRARLEENLKHLPASLPAARRRSLQEIALTLERQLRDLRQGVMQVRLVPIGEIFARMQFAVRDLMRVTGKEVALDISGQETEIDKFVVERMMDPLLHLVRNAVSHGIESPQERVAAGKPPAGRVALRASTAGEMVTVEIEDDGRGIDIRRVFERGRQQGLISEPAENFDPDNTDAQTVLDLLCSPGFSTREEADLASGRGVGMAIVKTTVQELGGVVTFKTRPGNGTHFTIHLPLTLAITDALIVRVCDQTFAIPQSSVREVMDIDKSAIIRLEGHEIISYRGQILPLNYLERLFNCVSDSETAAEKLTVVAIGNGVSSAGLVVNRIVGLREIVVRPLTDPFVQSPGIAGATELGDGRVVLILDVVALIRSQNPAHLSARNQRRTPNYETRSNSI
ncbi:MAG: chemotaxis protein CheA [Limnospira sp.]